MYYHNFSTKNLHRENRILENKEHFVKHFIYIVRKIKKKKNQNEYFFHSLIFNNSSWEKKMWCLLACHVAKRLLLLLSMFVLKSDPQVDTSGLWTWTHWRLWNKNIAPPLWLCPYVRRETRNSPKAEQILITYVCSCICVLVVPLVPKSIPNIDLA